MSRPLYVIQRVDCEATQPALRDRALGERSAYGHADVLEAEGWRGSYFAIPSEAQENAALYQALRQRGHQVGLHAHPADHGYSEFLGIYGPEDQQRIIQEATALFTESLGFEPEGICLGYGSSNDFTHGVLYDLGYRHGVTMVTRRILPECAAVHGGAPLDPFYAHRYNRVLEGDLNFVELVHTIDPDSRMWGGKHPQDLRVELVDAKNHYYTIAKSIRRQLNADTPILTLHVSTHNVFEYGDERDFRRQTLIGVIKHIKRLAQEHDLEIVGATAAETAAAYRAAVPLGSRMFDLKLDRRGWRSADDTATTLQPR